MAAQDDKEMRDLLVRLDESVKMGFQHMNEKLDQMNRRADGQDLRMDRNDQRAEKQEGRIRALEDWRTEVIGGTKGISLGGRLLSMLIGAGLTVAAYLGLSVVQAPKTVPVNQTTNHINR